MKRFLKIVLILILILVPACLLGVIVLGSVDPDAELTDWTDDVFGAAADRLPPDWDMAAITTGAARTAGLDGGENECQVIAWKIETNGSTAVSERCIAWIHNREGTNHRWALVNLRRDGDAWRAKHAPRETGKGVSPDELRLVFGYAPAIEHLKDFMDGASWSFAAQEKGAQLKDADIARHAGRRLFGVHMNFLLRRYRGEAREPAAPPTEKRMPPPPPRTKR